MNVLLIFFGVILYLQPLQAALFSLVILSLCKSLHKGNWSSFMGLQCISGSFLKVMYKMRIFLGGCKNFKYFLDIPNIFGG